MAVSKSLVNVKAFRILARLRRSINEFFTLTAGEMYDVSKIVQNYDNVIHALGDIAHQNNAAAFLSAEITVLEVERTQLDFVLSQYGSEGFAITRELKTDRTSLQNGIDELNRAFAALALRERDPAMYHDISDASRPLGELDSYGVSKDVVRKCTRSQAKRLQDQARGKSKSALDRKEQSVLAARRGNMDTCERVYIEEQRHYAQERAER
ncbi:MAG: hypothetical protein LIQ31_04890 [Planctomycetes bacterium]|nr:hypothetical protein [Planctomycetota bacterium]